MTVVAFDGRRVAVDSGGSSNDTIHRVQKWELYENNTKLLVRVGNSMVSAALLEWYKGERDFPNAAHLADGLAELLVFYLGGIVSSGSAYPYEYDGLIRCQRFSNSKTPDVIADACAFGSGKDFAYGALYCGAPAYQATAAACFYSPWCADPVHVFKLNRQGAWELENEPAAA